MLDMMLPLSARRTVTPRDYQAEYIDGVKEEWAEGRNKVLLVAPTGSGKTVIGGLIIAHEVNDRKGRVLVVTDRKKLTRQFAARTEQDFGIPCGIEMADTGHGGEPVVCATVQTITNRIAQGKFHADEFTLIFMDEAHLALAKSWQAVANHFKGARIVGLTATPRRGDKKDLLTFFDSMVEKRTLGQLIEEGHLAPLTIKNIPINIRLEREGKGDFDDGEINHAIEPYLERCAESMVEFGSERCCLAFLPLIDTSKKFAAMLNNLGMKAEHVDGTMDEGEVSSAIRRLEMGKISALTCSQILGVGVDIRPVNLICNLRPTRSWTMFVQFTGRGTRTFNPVRDGPKGTTWPLKEECLLLDPLWLTSDHNLLMRPAVLVASDDDEMEAVDAKLKKGGGSLMEAKASATAEREERLRKRLEAMQKRKERTVNAMEFFLKAGFVDYAEYEPLNDLEARPISFLTPRQHDWIVKSKFDIDSIKCMGQAKKILDVLGDRAKKRLATVGQVKYAIGLGAEEGAAWKMSFDEASSWIDSHAPRKSYSYRK